MKPSRAAKAILLLILTGVAGVLSSLLSMMVEPVYGVRGAVFGVVLGLGILLTGWLGHRWPGKGAYPGIGLALGVAALTGCAAAAILAWHGHAYPLRAHYDFPPPSYPKGVGLWFVCILYAVLLHGIYAARGFVRFPTWGVFLGSLAAGVVAGALRVVLAEGPDFTHPGELLIPALFTGVPFCLLWMIAVRTADPDWSPEERQPPQGGAGGDADGIDAGGGRRL